MKIISGKYNNAVVYTDNIEQSAEEQIKSYCDMEIFEKSNIRIMPDVHAGSGCTIGTTMTIADKIIPDFVGVDLGCGVLCIKLDTKNINLEKFDDYIKRNIPHGFSIRNKIHESVDQTLLDNLYCIDCLDKDPALKALGSIGSGNHFIELDKSNKDDFYLIIHCGSRNPGLKVANFYQNKIGDKGYLEGELFEQYIHDSFMMNNFACINRKIVADEIIKYLQCNIIYKFETIHNYLSVCPITKQYILRKGSVSAYKDEILIIPMNMRDGSLICKGKGNPEWNYSAPHGAGRLMSRAQAKKNLSIEEFTKEMKDVYSTTVNINTIDESPMAYKSSDEIINNIKDTVDIIEHIKPIYNFKAE